MPDPTRPHAVRNAILLGFSGFTIWTITDAMTRYLRDYPPMQLALVSGLYALATMVAFAPYLGGMRASFRLPRMGLQMARGAVLAVCSLMSFYAFTHLPMPTAYTIIFLSPIMAKVASMRLNGEVVKKSLWGVSLLGLAGVLIALRPWGGIGHLGLGHAAAFCIPVLFSVGVVLGRTIGEQNQTPISMCIFIDLATVILFAVPVYLGFMPMEPLHFALTVAIGVFGFLAGVMVYSAFARAPAAYVAPVHYTQIIWGVVWSIVFFREYPDVWTVAGIAVISASGLALIALGRKA